MGQAKLLMKRESLYFTADRKIDIRSEDVPPLQKANIQLSSLASLISAGSEMLVYRNELSSQLPMNEVLPGLEGHFNYPLKFGYSIVGSADPHIGAKVQGNLRYFALNPHENIFQINPKKYLQVPVDCPTNDAIFLANMETAINIIMDAKLGIGENVVVIGLGVVGLLTTALLNKHPIGKLAVMDPLAIRREAASEIGQLDVYDPKISKQVKAAKNSFGKSGADLVIELSGQPESLNLAMDLVGTQGRIIVGSWYGQRSAEINLGSHFHQGRVQIISSHVGQINPEFRGRWSRKRRFALAWQWLKQIQPSQWITHSFSLDEAAKAYQLIDAHPEQCIAIALEYD